MLHDADTVEKYYNKKDSIAKSAQGDELWSRVRGDVCYRAGLYYIEDGIAGLGGKCLRYTPLMSAITAEKKTFFVRLSV